MKAIMHYWNMVEDVVIQYAGKVVLAIVILIIGWWLINKLTASMQRWMNKREVDLSLRPFLKTITKFTLRLLLIISIASMLGIETTSFITIIGAAGLAVGLALQGSLANFAGGVVILLLKPFKVGEFIEFDDKMGTVSEIHVFYTYLKSIHNQELVIPNGKLANVSITNYSRYDTRRMDMKFKIGYGADIDKVRKTLDELISNEEALAKVPQHVIFVEELAENYMIVNLRAWLETDKYWDVVNSFPEKAKRRFDEEGIVLPFKELNIQLSKESRF